jgi:hypothetical protein
VRACALADRKAGAQGAVLHYRTRHSTKLLPSVTLVKEYSTNILSVKGSLSSTFSDAQQRLCRMSKSTRQRKALDKLRITKKPKKSKTFLNYGNNSPTTTHYHTHRTIIFHYYFELNLHVLCHNLSRAYPPLPLHYYINYVYITFSFLMYYNKLRVILLFEALNEFILKCDQL